MSQLLEDSKTEDSMTACETTSEPGTSSDGDHEMVQYIKDLYASGAKMWTKEMFRDVEAEMAKEPMPYSIMIRSMNGALRRKQISGQMDDPDLFVHLYFKLYQSIIYDAKEMTFEVDPDEEMELDTREDDSDDERALATRALSLAWTAGTSSSIEYSQLKAAWDEARRNWVQSATCNELSTILGKSAYIPKNNRSIVCFGLGSLEGSPDHSCLNVLATSDGLPYRSAMTQHAAALTMSAVLGERLGTNPLPVKVQDPAYSLVAKQLLADEGFEVVEGYGALAFTYVDEGTVVFSCSPNIPVKQVVADIARPAAMIWNQVKPATEEKSEFVIELMNGKEVRRSPWSTDQDSDRTRKLVEGYYKYDFPAERERFGNLEIYTRKDEESCVSFSDGAK